MKLKVASSSSLVILSLSPSSPPCQHGNKISSLTGDQNYEDSHSSPPPPPPPPPAVPGKTGAMRGDRMLAVCRH